MPPNWLKTLSKVHPPGRGVGVDGSASAVAARSSSTSNDELDGEAVVKRRHGDWGENQFRWRWLADSYEGGNRYRNAIYGVDRKGLPNRNLVRHNREYPDPQKFANNYYGGFPSVMGIAPETAGMIAVADGVGPWPGQLGASPTATALDDEYELRRARTPPPEWVAECVGIHLSKVFDQEVHRDWPSDLTAWALDVDGRGTPFDDWIRETVAPLLLVCGNLDICLDHPQKPPGANVVTRADEVALGLDKCIASYIMPENMLWWRLDNAGRYAECLVREYVDAADRADVDDDGHAIDPDATSKEAEAWRRSYVRYRLWSATESVLFSFDGGEILERTPHTYGRVPIVRLIDQRKHRSPHIGKSRYEAVAEYQIAYYNLDSESIFSNTLQAHPSLSGPEDYCKADNTLTVGPGNILPKKKNQEGGGYEGWDYVSPPKDPADSLRKDKQALVDLKDRAACLTKPAGVAGTSANSVSQSGTSKELDSHTGHKQLTSIARSLAKSERAIAEFASIVLRNRTPTQADRDAIIVVYPAKFELYSAAELIDSTTKLQLVFASAGEAPLVEGLAIRSIVRQLLLGLTDKEYEELDDEIDVVLATKSQFKQHAREVADAGLTDAASATAGDGSSEADAGRDPGGQSAGTLVSGAVAAFA